MSLRVILIAVFSLILSGCLAGELELAPEGEAGYDVTASELYDEGAEALEAPAGEADIEPLCEPGPPSNWCQNVQGTSCSSTTFRRCYLPNYCEWMVCLCEGGSWNCQY